MLRSSYAALEEEARKGRIALVIAALLHLSTSMVAITAASRSSAMAMVQILFQLGLCAALFAGKNWARWVLFLINLVAGGVTVYLLSSGQIHATYYVARTAVYGVVILLLLLPWSKSYIIWKNMRF